jgi:putative ABC transport system permease protein
VDPSLQLRDAGPLTGAYDGVGRQRGLAALAVGLLAGSVLLLSAAGIHALMSFTVHQRRREIGVRAALGADGPRVLGAVLARAAWQLALGVVVGLALASWVEWYSGGKMMGGHAFVVVPVVATFMVVVGLLAAAGPARRGLRVHPTEALRAEV